MKGAGGETLDIFLPRGLVFFASLQFIMAHQSVLNIPSYLKLAYQLIGFASIRRMGKYSKNHWLDSRT